MIEKRFLENVNSFWVTSKVLFMYTLMLLLVYGCSNEITGEQVT